MIAGHAVIVLVDAGFQYGALGVARSLGRLGVPVHAFGATRGGSAMHSRYFSALHAFPGAPTAWGTAALTELIGLGRRLGDAILIPTSDATVGFVEQHAEELAGVLLFPRQPPGLAETLSNKQQMYELALTHSVPTPRSLFPATHEEGRAALDAVEYPVVVKPIDNAIAPDGVRASIARQREDALRLVDKLVGNVVLQEYIPGGSETVWMFNGYFDGDSRCVFGLTGRKLRQYPPYGGVTTLGRCEPNHVVETQAVDLMEAVGYRGILDCGFRFDERDGCYKLLDINPRIGATFRLFVDSGGLDVARAFYLDLTGQPVTRRPPINGRRWQVEDIDLSASLRYMRDGVVGPAAWLRSMVGVNERAWFARDDLRPSFHLAVVRARRFVERLARRLRALRQGES